MRVGIIGLGLMESFKEELKILVIFDKAKKFTVLARIDVLVSVNEGDRFAY